MSEASTPPPGTFLAIPLADGSVGYGRVLVAPYLACYRYRTPTRSTDLDALEAAAVLFIVAVEQPYADRWPAVGRRELTGPVAEPVVRFIQDPLDPARCVIFDSAGGRRNAEPQDCVGLERAAVWRPDQIEQRLLDHFLGRPNQAEIHARVQL
jgi:hypothetical protein